MSVRRKLIIGTILVGVVLAAIPLIVFEWRHYRTHGHLVCYGLHVDVLNEDFSIAIRGQTKLYWAELSNYSLSTVRLPGCRQPTDIVFPPVEYPYAVQRFDEPSNQPFGRLQEKEDPKLSTCLLYTSDAADE